LRQLDCVGWWKPQSESGLLLLYCDIINVFANRHSHYVVTNHVPYNVTDGITNHVPYNVTDDITNRVPHDVPNHIVSDSVTDTITN
jgi:hypothetical protein